MKATNANFYTDPIELTDDTKCDYLEPFIKGYSTPLSFYLAALEEHRTALVKAIDSNPTIKDIRISWDASVGECKVIGSKPWTQDRIDEFDGAMKGKPDASGEIEQMKMLIARYPKEATLEVARSYSVEDVQITDKQ